MAHMHGVYRVLLTVLHDDTVGNYEMPRDHAGAEVLLAARFAQQFALNNVAHDLARFADDP